MMMMSVVGVEVVVAGDGKQRRRESLQTVTETR